MALLSLLSFRPRRAGLVLLLGLITTVCAKAVFEKDPSQLSLEEIEHSLQVNLSIFMASYYRQLTFKSGMLDCASSIS